MRVQIAAPLAVASNASSRGRSGIDTANTPVGYPASLMK
jgi:hypothetical protein